MNAFEKPPINNFEKELEFIPTPKEVRLIFEKLLEGGKYETLRQLEDEKGLYLWEIKVSKKQKDGGSTEYLYMRERHDVEEFASCTTIDVVFLNQEGLFDGGEQIAKYIDGKWRFTP